MSPLLDEVREALADAAAAYAGHPAAAAVAGLAARLDEPLRVAIAGKVKAGKSTLLNALVGEELAPTDAGECTKIVTWYVDGLSYRAVLEPRGGGAPVPLQFRREDGPVEVDLGGHAADDVERLVIEWPSSALRAMSLIDTPGIASLSTEVSARTHDFLGGSDDHITPADAVLYLMRHLHSSDIDFLETFHDQEFSRPTPVNAIAVLSRADEIGVGRLGAMGSAERIAARYRADPKIRRLCQTVVPVAGLLAQSGSTLREAEYQAIVRLAALPEAERESLLLSADRFAGMASISVDVTPIERDRLLGRFGLYGIRVGIELVRAGTVRNSSELSEALVARSGLTRLLDVLREQFGARRDVLKARSVLLGLDAVARANPVPGSDAVRSSLERVLASAHELSELRLLNALRLGAVEVGEAEAAAMERLLGSEGTSIPARLGLAADADADVQRRAVTAELERWQRRAENPLSSRDVADAARDLVRTCSGMFVALQQQAG